MKSIKSLRKEFKEQGVFYTPKALAEKLRSYIDYEPTSVYDPTCGAGSLLSVFDDGIPKYGQELDGSQLELIKLPNFKGYAGDTLEDDGFSGMKFNCIVANPPFSIRWNPEVHREDPRFKDLPALPPPSKADWAFMAHILYHLDGKGKAVILEFPGILYRGQREYKVRRWFCENNFIERVAEIEGGVFEDTAIATCLIVLSKGKRDTSIIFERKGKAYIADPTEVSENDFTLSPSQYIPDEIEEKNFDPEELEAEARRSFLARMEKELLFEKMVCRLEGYDMGPFLLDIKAIIDQYLEEGGNDSGGTAQNAGNQPAEHGGNLRR